jgi:hypothetical protein
MIDFFLLVPAKLQGRKKYHKKVALSTVNNKKIPFKTEQDFLIVYFSHRAHVLLTSLVNRTRERMRASRVGWGGCLPAGRQAADCGANYRAARWRSVVGAAVRRAADVGLSERSVADVGHRAGN